MRTRLNRPPTWSGSVVSRKRSTVPIGNSFSKTASNFPSLSVGMATSTNRSSWPRHHGVSHPNIQARLRRLNQAPQLGHQQTSADLIVRIALLQQLLPDFTDREVLPAPSKLKGSF